MSTTKFNGTLTDVNMLAFLDGDGNPIAIFALSDIRSVTSSGREIWIWLNGIDRGWSMPPEDPKNITRYMRTIFDALSANRKAK